MTNIISGIYILKNIKNNKPYVGSTNNFNRRKEDHLFTLQANKHHSSSLQNAFNKYGEENFIFEIVEYVTQLEGESDINFGKRLTTVHEQLHLDRYGAQELIRKENYRFRKTTYNICPTAGSSLGRQCSNEHRRKLIIARNKRDSYSDKTRLKMSRGVSAARARDEVKVNHQKALIKRPLLICPHCLYESYNKGSIMRRHFDRCKFSPTYNEENEKLRLQVEKAKKKESLKDRPSLSCPHCLKKSQNKGLMIRFHFDKCSVFTGEKTTRSQASKDKLVQTWAKRKLLK